MRAVFGLGCLLSFVSFGSAHAQVGSAVLLPARGDDRLPAQREAAQQALSDALSAQGYQVVSHADALTRLPEGAVACGAVDCAPNMLRALSLNLAAACAVWLSPDAPEGTVFVTLVDDAGARYPGARPVHAADLAVATRAALADARALQMLGPGPWVRIHGQPEGAKVFIDDQLAGTLPYRAAMTAGRYALRVESDGHLPEEQDLDIPLNAGRVVEVEVNLVPGEAPASTDRRGDPLWSPASVDITTSTERRAHVADYILGSALAVGGLGLMLAYPINTAVTDGDCADRACRTVYRSTGITPRTAVAALGGTALMFAGAIVALVWKPFSVQVTAGSETSLSISRQF